MNFRIVNMTALLDGPNGQQIDVLTPNEQVTGTGQVSGTFTEVVNSVGTKGWILTADAALIGQESRPDLDVGDFVSQCFGVEAAFNELPDTAPWFVSADYLIARAIIETDLRNAGSKSPGSDAVGPLQVSSKEWTDFLASGSTLVDNFRLGDFDNPMHQVYGAAHSMYRAGKDISALKTPQGASDIFVPSNLDLLHDHLTGSAKAAVAILDAANSGADRNKPINDCLAPVMDGAALTAFFAAYAQFTGPTNQPKSIAAFVQATGAAFDAALKRAFDLIRQFVPEEANQIKQGEAPWFDVAQTENAANIAEPNPRILTYFQATDLRPLPASTETPWCGAFAAFCMAQSGSPAAAASIPKGAALAVNWKKWGVPLPTKSNDVPNGAVVVLTPGAGSGGSGHVGFFVGYTPNRSHITLLGGNQSNRIKPSNFPISRIAAIRWLDLQPTTSAEQASAKPSNVPISQKALDLIVEFEVTSKAVYEQKYRAPEWPGESSGVTIGIGYDVGHTPAATFEADWKDRIPDGMLTALRATVGVTGVAAKPLARRLRSVVNIPWETAIAVHSERVVPRWVGVVNSALQNTDKIKPDSLGALVSLTYNRGASYSKPDHTPNQRYREMHQIKDCMAAQMFGQIPQLIEDMKRLWPNSKGLRDRRDREAALFRKGLS